MKRILKSIGFLIIILMLVFVIGFTYFTGKAVFEGMFNSIPREDTIKNLELNQGYRDFAKKYKVQHIEIPSSKDDHKIPAICVKEGDKGVAVLIHGLGGTKEWVYPVMETFLDLGYSVIAYDQRASGENLALYNTFGILESYDALDVVDYVKTEVGSGGDIILWGQSFGGSTAAIALGRDEENIDYLILDCPVADSYELTEPIFKEIESKQGIPIGHMVFAGNIYSRLELGISIKDIDASHWLKDTTKPVLITNSSIDQVTPEHMGRQMYDALSHDKKQIYTTDKYGHCKFPYEEEEVYKTLVKDFLNKY